MKDNRKNRYIKSNCRVCGGPIEFPAHGLGEKICCPHCLEHIELAKPALSVRLLEWNRKLAAELLAVLAVLVRPLSIIIGWGWRRRPTLPSFSSKWAVVLASVVLGGTTIFIYFDHRAEMRKRDRQQAEHQREQAEAEEERQFQRDREQAEQKMEALEEDGRRFRLQNAADQQRDRQYQQSLDAIAAQLEQANWQAKWDKIERDNTTRMEQDERRRDQLSRESQERQAQIQRDYQEGMDRIQRNYDSQWVLRYNPYTGRHQYAPRSARLKYNYLENRYEWVP